jgi:hypothetical protein
VFVALVLCGPNWQCEGRGFESPQLHNLIQHASRPLTWENRFGGRSSFLIHYGQWSAGPEKSGELVLITAKQGQRTRQDRSPDRVVVCGNLWDRRWCALAPLRWATSEQSGSPAINSAL